eukprot:COSAG01_NODE_95_length_26957_cov_48.328617_16_plen_525_part_00
MAAEKRWRYHTQAPPTALLAFDPPAVAVEFKGPAGQLIAFGEDKDGVMEGSAIELGKCLGHVGTLTSTSSLASVEVSRAHWTGPALGLSRDDGTNTTCVMGRSGRYVSLLCKGNPMVLEPLFVGAAGAPGAEVVVQDSWVWRELVEQHARRCLFTRRAVRQYLGFVDDRLRKAQRALEAAPTEIKAASKYLYHAMHKLTQLQAIAAGREPRIYLPSVDGGSSHGDGAPVADDRERIMRVRLCVANSGDGDGDGSAYGAPQPCNVVGAGVPPKAAAAAGDGGGGGGLRTARAEGVLRAALGAARAEFAQLRAMMERREGGGVMQTLPEEVDFEALNAWLLSVRARTFGFDIDRPQGGGHAAPLDRAAEVGDSVLALSEAPKVSGPAPALLPRQISASSMGSSSQSSVSDAAVAAATAVATNGDGDGDGEDVEQQQQQLLLSQSATTDEEPVSVHRLEHVRSVLCQFQREERVRLVFAAERSSRSYGWAHRCASRAPSPPQFLPASQQFHRGAALCWGTGADEWKS